MQRKQNRDLHEVNAYRLTGEAMLGEHGVYLRGHVVSNPGVRVERAAQRGDPGPGPGLAVQPRVVQLMVPRGRAEVPDDRFAAAGEEREPDELVHRPGTDMGRGHVADVGEVEGQQRAELRFLQGVLQATQPFLAQPVNIDPLLPVDRVLPVCADGHSGTSIRIVGGLASRP